MKQRTGWTPAALVMLASVAPALAQTFTGAAPPGTPGQPYDWFAIRDTGVVCGGPSNHFLVNNWGSQWCNTSPTPPFPSGNINLAGFDVFCFRDTTTASLTNPAGGTLRLGLNIQSFGTVTNAGTIAIGRGGGSSRLLATTITNTGTIACSGGGNGMSVGNVTINNQGTITNSGGSYDWSVTSGQPWSGPCTLTTTGVVESVQNGSLNGFGNFTGWTINANAGDIRTQANCSMDFPNCTITSQPGATWTTGTGSIFAGMDFSNSSLQGTFQGSTSSTGGMRLNGTITFPENTTFNIGGHGIYRWVGPTFNIAPGKTVTNAGRMWAIAPHTHQTTGNFVNAGTFEHGGTIQLNNSTYTNAPGGTYNFLNGVFSSAGPNQIVNNGLMQATGSNGGVTFQAVNVTNAAIIRNDLTSGESIGFTNGTTVTSLAGASWIVTGGGNGGFDFANATISGTFNGSTIDNNDWRINQSLNVADNTTFNITGGGITRWVNSGITIAPGKTLRNLGRMNHINGSTYSGSVVNDGTFEYYNGATTFNNHTFTNNGTITWYIHAFNSSGGTNAFINNGTITVVPNNFNTQVDVPVINHGLIQIGSSSQASSWGGSVISFSQGPTGVVRLAAPTEPTSYFSIPSDATIAGGTIEGNGGISVDGLGSANFGNILLNANDRAAGSGRLQLRGFANLSSSTRLRVLATGAGANSIVECWRTMDLGGATLEVQFAPGYSPALGSTINVIGAQSRVGTLGSVVALGGNVGLILSPTYTPTGVVLTVANAGCDSVDFNNDTITPDSADLDDFLAVLAGGPGACSNTPNCGDLDFNNDGLFPDSLDLDAFLSRLSGGACL